MEQTFIMIKPDGVQRKLIGEIVSRFENKGFTLVKAELKTVTEEIAKEHYKEHEGKHFFPNLMKFITSGPVFTMIWEGDRAIEIARLMIGATDPSASQPGTIRGDFSHSGTYNIIHGSDSVESAEREIELWFN